MSPFTLNKTQMFRIEKLIYPLEHTDYLRGTESEDKLSEPLAIVFNQFEAFGIKILKFCDDDRLSIRNLDGIELTSAELDRKLEEIESASHLPRIDKGTNGKINSINSIQSGPNQKLLNAIANAKNPAYKIPRSVEIQLANHAMQTAFTTIEEMEAELGIDGTILYVQYIQDYAAFCAKLAHDKKMSGFRNKFSEITSDHASVEATKKIKIRKTRAEKEAKRAEKKIKVKVAKPKDNWTFIRNEWNNALSDRDAANIHKNFNHDPNTDRAFVEQYLEMFQVK